MKNSPRRTAPSRKTARELFSRGQIILILVIGAPIPVCLIAWPRQTATVLASAALLFYFLFVGLKLTLHIASRRYVPPAISPVSIDDPDLPTYTVLIPLYKEANMLGSLVRSIAGLSYPKDRLQVLLLLEDDDTETRAEAIGLGLPDWCTTVVIPDLAPKGKPKALNVGLAHATGVHTVIYDAEDRPDHDQLLKAVAAFRASGRDLACVQARLFFWNEDSSWITRFYWSEYVIHFERVLPGLSKLGLIPPLGGTSNHFRTEALRRTALSQALLPPGAEGIGGWDPWNVTEDAELAGAMAARGYRIAMIDSVTREEATASPGVANRQRRRWLKGFLQTGLVYTRQPYRTARQMGFLRWFCYTLLMLGTPVSLLLNPLFWGLTIIYAITRSTLIESMFPIPLLGALLMVVGNLLFFYQLVGACVNRGGYGSVKYLLLTPVWWAFTSWSAYGVLWELARPSTRHKWNKTPHGHDLGKEKGQHIEGSGAFTGMEPVPNPAVHGPYD